jgi:Tol biopolymer transport system component
MRFKKNMAAVVLAVAAGVVLFAATPQQETASGLFERAVYLEETKGDLVKAIEIYNSVLEKFAENHAIAAKALYRVGLCHEKLGSEEAQKAYRRLIDQYPGQKEEVALARARLAELATASAMTVPAKPTFRKIRIPTRIGGHICLSPDGRKISHAGPQDGKLMIMPLTSNLGPDFPGEPFELDTGGMRVGWYGHAWSGDGKWIAFNFDVPKEELGEQDEEGSNGIYVVSSGGGKPKKVLVNYRDLRLVNYRISLSPDGKILAFSSVDRVKNEQHIFTMPVDGTAPKLLVEAQAREPVFSPDGRMIAYVEDQDLGGGGGGLFVVPAQGGVPKLVAEARVPSSPVWSPKGDMIAFVENRPLATGRGRIHVVPLGRDGKAAGEATVFDAPEGIGSVDFLAGWTPDDKIGARLTTRQEFGLYTLPSGGGKATLVSYGGYPTKPRWSPDGKKIFHANIAPEGSGDWYKLAISVIPAEGGEVTAIPIQSDLKIEIDPVDGGNKVSPDGRMIVFPGKTPENSGGGIWILPVEGGRARQLVRTPDSFEDLVPCWSPDGKAVAFVRYGVPDNQNEVGEADIYIVDSAGGEPTRLTSESDRVNPASLAWSPDGKLIAYFSRSEGSVDGTLNVIPSNGGKSRAVGKVQAIYTNKEMAWSPDSKRIAFNTTFGTRQGLHREPKTIRIMSLEDGSVEDIETGLVETSIYHLDWSPDGEKFVFAGWQGGEREFWLMENFLHLVKGAR